MTFNKIMLFFCIGLPICITARVLQITQTIDYSNGFYFLEKEVLGNILMVIILAVCAGLGFAAFKAYKKPEHLPRDNKILSVSSSFLLLVLIVQFFAEKPPIAMLQWQAMCVKIATLTCIVYFIVLAVREHMGLATPAIFHIIPSIYVIAKTVFTFIGVSSLAIISDNILLVSAYCALMVFFINYGKLYNKLDVELNFRKILASGLTSSLLCLTQSVSYFIVNAFGTESYLHTDLSVMLGMAAFGVFSIVFIVSHFYKTA